MKKFLIILLALMMVLAFTACGGDEPAPDNDDVQQEQEQQEEQNNEQENDEPDQTDNQVSANKETETDEEAAPVKTSGLPEGWPDNEYTAMVPIPDEGGKVLTCGEIGTLFAIELKWEMEQGLAYAQKLQDAGFGEDCAEKYEKYGYIDRTANGVNVQLMDAFGTTSLSIMPVEE